MVKNLGELTGDIFGEVKVLQIKQDRRFILLNEKLGPIKNYIIKIEFEWMKIKEDFEACLLN